MFLYHLLLYPLLPEAGAANKYEGSVRYKNSLLRTVVLTEAEVDWN